MKKIIVGAVALAVFGFAPPAVGHGTCTAIAHRPSHSGQWVDFKGTVGCGTTLHKITVTAYLYRRTPGYDWQTYSIDMAYISGVTTKISAEGSFYGFNCNKDYRVITIGRATDPDGGGTSHNVNDTGSPLLHTC